MLGRNRRSRPAGRPTGGMVEIMWIARFIGMHEGKFSCHGFAHDDRPCLAQKLNKPRHMFGLAACKNRCAALSRHFGRVYDVL